LSRDPRSRDDLHQRLTEVLGAPHADTLMEALPPHSRDELATKTDLGVLKADIEHVKADVEHVKADVEHVKADVGLLRIGFERFEERLDQMDEHWTTRLELTEHRLTAVFRGELHAAITSQTRSILLSVLGATLATGSLVLAAARLG
jgi:hypothetical protein